MSGNLFQLMGVKRRKEDSELISELFSLRVTKGEMSFIITQAKEEFTSRNNLIRKALKKYKDDVGLKPL